MYPAAAQRGPCGFFVDSARQTTPRGHGAERSDGGGGFARTQRTRCYPRAMADPLLDVLPWHNVPYEEQLDRRQAMVASALQNARITVAVLPVIPSPRVTGSRARVKLRGGPDGTLGFHRPGTHDFVRVPLDAVARPEIVVTAERLESCGGVRGECEIRSDGGRTQVVADHPVPGFGPVAIRGKGPPLSVLGLRASPRSFYQVNLEVNERIVDDVDAVLQELAPIAILDLYGGIGNLTARAHRRGTTVTLVENEPSAVDDARHNLHGAAVEKKDAGRFSPGDFFYDVVVLDPPRAGAPALLPKLAVTRPRAILYLSCDPLTLARDIASVIPLGYGVDRVQPYDMFPGTEHVETLVVLTRTSRR